MEMSGSNPGQPRPSMDQNFRGPRPMFNMAMGPNQGSGPNNGAPFRPPFDGNFGPPINQGMPPPFMGPNGPRNNLSMPPGGPRGPFMRPPPMMQNNFMPMQMNPVQRPMLPKIDPGKEVWVETNSAEGKVYFYNAKTRQSVWKRPTGENIQVIMQSEAQSLAAASKTAGGERGNNNNEERQNNHSNPNDQIMNQPPHVTDQNGDHLGSEAPGTSDNEESELNNRHVNEAPGVRTATPLSTDSPLPDQQQQEPMETNENQRPPSQQQQQPPPQAVIGMPIRMQNQVPLRPMMGQGPPGMMGGPRGPMPPMMMNMPMRMPGMMPRFVPPPMMGGPPGMRPPMIMPNPTEWRENTAPDSGRKYYYNIRTMETQWTKPKELEDFEAASKGMLGAQPNDISAMNPSARNEDAEAEKAMMEKRAEEEAEKARLQEEAEKQEEMDKQKQEQQEKQQKQRPVATKAVPGTPWCIVWTGDDKVFFYNPTTKLSMWDRPDELGDRTDVDRILADPPHKAGKKREIDETPPPTTAATGNNSPAAVIQQQNDEPLMKKKKNEKKVEKAPEPKNQKPQMPYEERIKHFKAMLLERQVSAFSTWDKEVHKIVFDPRFNLIKGKERKQVYNDFIKTRSDDERKERKANLLKAKEEYKTLLSEVNSSGKMGFSEFAAKYSKEDRFRKIEKMKDREALFNEFNQENKKRKLEEIKNKEEKVWGTLFLDFVGYPGHPIPSPSPQPYSTPLPKPSLYKIYGRFPTVLEHLSDIFNA